jgi:hypothetical protein
LKGRRERDPQKEVCIRADMQRLPQRQPNADEGDRLCNAPRSGGPEPRARLAYGSHRVHCVGVSLTKNPCARPSQYAAR